MSLRTSDRLFGRCKEPQHINTQAACCHSTGCSTQKANSLQGGGIQIPWGEQLNKPVLPHIAAVGAIPGMKLYRIQHNTGPEQNSLQSLDDNQKPLMNNTCEQTQPTLLPFA